MKGKSNSEDTENLEAVWFIKHQSKVVLENPESLLGATTQMFLYMFVENMF